MTAAITGNRTDYAEGAGPLTFKSIRRLGEQGYNTEGVDLIFPPDLGKRLFAGFLVRQGQKGFP